MGVPDILEFIRQGGALGVLIVIVIAFYTGRVVTRTQSEILISFWHERWEAAVSDVTEWKTLAKTSVTSNDRLADALETRNRIDEGRR